MLSGRVLGASLAPSWFQDAILRGFGTILEGFGPLFEAFWTNKSIRKTTQKTRRKNIDKVSPHTSKTWVERERKAAAWFSCSLMRAACSTVTSSLRIPCDMLTLPSLLWMSMRSYRFPTGVISLEYHGRSNNHFTYHFHTYHRSFTQLFG